MSHFPILAAIEPETMREHLYDVRTQMAQMLANGRLADWLLHTEQPLGRLSEPVTVPQTVYVRFPDGGICQADDPAFSGRFEVAGGKVYERSAGRLHHRKRSRAARKICVLPAPPANAGQIARKRRLLNMERKQLRIAVEYALESLLEPYEEGTSNPSYLEFVDAEEEVVQRYETGTMACVRFPDGRIRAAYEREVYDKFLIDRGKICQRNSGPLHHSRRSKQAKKLKLMPEYPIKRMWSSYEKFAEEYFSYEYDEEYGAYGYYCNPNAMWDWYQLGGRWPYEFLVKADCRTAIAADRDFFDSEDREPAAPAGYRWVCGARKADIQWDVMKRLAVKNELACYKQYRRWFQQGNISGRVSPLLSITENGIENWGDALYLKGETPEEHLARMGLSRRDKFPCSPFAIVDEDGWQKSGKMGWFGISTKNMEERAWRDIVQAFLDALPMETFLITVDCHI